MIIVVLYFGNAATGIVREAMMSRLIGCIVTPAEGKRPPEGAIWGADNGKFGKGYPGDEKWLRWLETFAALADSCWFAVAPDAPFDALGTLALSPRFFAAIRDMGLPAALAAQNGMEHMELPWDDFDVLCLGGDYAWKRGLGAARLTREALARGKSVHWLRGNSYKAIAHAAGIGCRSADGTFLTYAPEKNLQRVQCWLDKIDRYGIQGYVA